MAGDSVLTSSWKPVADRISTEATADWDDSVAVERLEKAGVTFVRGRGRLTGERTVEVDGRSYVAARGVVLNTGTEPAVPPVDGLAGTPYWTNRDAVRVTDLPGSMTVIGGGAIGAELSQAFSRFGVQVTVLEVADRILAREEPEASATVADAFAREGIQVLSGVKIASVGYQDGEFLLDVDGLSLRSDKLLVAAGRRTSLSDLGLDTVGLDPDARFIDVDSRMRAAEGLYAIGDVTGKGGFTHISMYQAAIVVRDIIGQDGPEGDYRAVPRVTFTDPEVGSVGITEKQAREQGRNVRVGLTRIPDSTRGWIHKVGNEGIIKLVEDADRGVLVGATAVGPNGGEVLSMLTTAVHAEVATATLKSMIYAYPTFHRAVEDALDKLG
jgi:pyruvate/2-oxoglutarate dehydrogenase complex dihydrolipoamide dehydrogenase (E3) component